MASSAIKNEDEKLEYFDPPEVLEKKINKLVKYIRRSSYFVAFTGAGISTSCGIPDFRSGYNTVLPTGPGAWEELAQKKPVKKKLKIVRITEAFPSKTHMSFPKLLDEGILKHVISQNVDGLHRKSGLSKDSISELHGNIYIEKCVKCGKDYLRDQDVATSQSASYHGTGNHCDNYDCNGDLVDNIINFGENLDSNVINRAFDEGNKADLCLAMGSSLRVTPAATIPKNIAKKGGKLVIVNLQKTPLDKLAKFVIHAFCDVVMEKVMEKLRLEIPEFRLRRYLHVTSDSGFTEIKGIEKDRSPYCYIKGVSVQTESNYERMKKAPFVAKVKDLNEEMRVKLRFQGHYGEPSLVIKVDPKVRDSVFLLEYNPFSREWAIENL